MAITAAQVKELRERTQAPMGECKKALEKTDGDIDQAIQVLRESGITKAAGKANREANEGLVVAKIADDGKKAAIIKVNCETDFVAKNDTFQAFVTELAAKSVDIEDGQLAEVIKDDLAVKIAEVGENLVIAGHTQYTIDGTGALSNYIHAGSKVGVLIEIGCNNEANSGSEVLTTLGKDISMHIAALNPGAMTREEMPQDEVDAEKALYAKQVEGKPAEIVEKILSGKLDKFYSQNVLLEQDFVRDGENTIAGMLANTGKELGDEISIRRYVRYQIGG